ncbi:hypothetical protein BDR04DRAFT_1116452 [Suillus decipiens]|nr:hypothetical protein BDR04DRAFT_1116452 [Suillus decipiens]
MTHTNSDRKKKYKANQPLPATSNSQASKQAQVEEAGKCNLIYYFYEHVEMNLDGQAGEVSDKNYKCYLGNHKILTITCTMKSSLNGEKTPDLVQLEQASLDIIDAFNKQVTKAFDNLDQAKFEELLAQWLMACDWQFEEVECPKFNVLLD